MATHQQLTCEMSKQFRLTILESDSTVHQHRLDSGTWCLGRELSCDLVLTSPVVSRRHAMLTFGAKGFSIKDLGSTAGTMVNGRQVTKTETFTYPQTIEIGDVTVKVEEDAPVVPPSPKNVDMPTLADEEVEITLSIDASMTSAPSVPGVADKTAARLDMLYSLPLQFAAESDLNKLYKLILTKVIELIPGAKRGALLIMEPASGTLVLRASVPEDAPAISRTLIKRAAEEKRAFIWGDDQLVNQDSSMSIMRLSIRTGMFVPLLWKDETVGVLSVDNPKHRMAFLNGDLQFMISVAHYAAAAVANQLLQDDIEANNRTLQHLLSNFSPKLRGKLMQKARSGRLQPGGEKSDVTILMSDLRGFTLMSAASDAEVVMQMLNDYFSVLGDIIFQHDGTIDKFIGDAILAVFGSPEPDEMHELNAVRCAIAMQEAIAGINERRRAEGRPCCDLGIGVDTGEVLHGFIGAAERMEFTVIGDTVNKASRFCDGAKANEILMGKSTHRAIKAAIPTESLTITTKHEGDMKGWKVRR